MWRFFISYHDKLCLICEVSQVVLRTPDKFLLRVTGCCMCEGEKEVGVLWAGSALQSGLAGFC